jgi:hypothetical protein
MDWKGWGHERGLIKDYSRICLEKLRKTMKNFNKYNWSELKGYYSVY